MPNCQRDMYIWFAMVTAKMAFDTTKQRLNPFKVENYQQLVKPPWYNQ